MDAVSLQLTAQTLDGARESIAAAQSGSPNQAMPAAPGAAPAVVLDLSDAAQQLMTLPSSSAR